MGSISIVFSRDSTRVLTLFLDSDHFSVWSVPDGQLMAVNRGERYGDGGYCSADFGVPGSASAGLIGFGTCNGTVDLWDVVKPRKGEASRPRQRSRVDIAPGEDSRFESFAFSGDGSKFLAACISVAYAYDLASLTQLGAYSTPTYWKSADWAPAGLRVLLSQRNNMCLWDFSRPEAPPVVTADVRPGARFCSWSPNGASYFVSRKLEGQAPEGPATYALEKRRAADGSLQVSLAVNLIPGNDFPRVSWSPDLHALVLARFDGDFAPRVMVFN